MNTKTLRAQLVMGLSTLALVAFLWPHEALAAGIVTTCDEAHLDTALSGGGFVTFNCGGAATITVTSTKTIGTDTTIDGGSLITISGGHSVGVFSVNTGVNFTVQNLTIADGQNSASKGAGGGGGIFNSGTLTVTNSTFSGNNADGFGGAIYNHSGTLTVTNSTFSGNSASTGGAINNGESHGGILVGGTLTVTNSTFSDNSASNGGGIENDGTLTVTNSTFSGNSADSDGGGGIANFYNKLTVTNSTFSGNYAAYGQSYGGGIYNVGGTLTVTNDTFSGNYANVGGAIYNDSGTLTLTNTIVANSTTGGNCSGTITDGGHNIDNDGTCLAGSPTNPLLDPAGLANNGGLTQTIALQMGSPAINTGNESVCSQPPVNSLDQRGYGRPGAGATSCSIGAYEYNAAPPLPTLVAALSATATEVLLTDASPFPDTGTIRIDSEEMTYNGRRLTAGTTAHAEAAATQPGMLLNVQRGVNGTTATAHPAGATVVLVTAATCVGDCDGSGDVTVNELITLVNIDLGTADASACPNGIPSGVEVDVALIIQAVNNALTNCPVP